VRFQIFVNITHRNKLHARRIKRKLIFGMFVTFTFGIFCRPLCSVQNKDWNTKLLQAYLCLLFCMSVKLGLVYRETEWRWSAPSEIFERRIGGGAGGWKKGHRADTRDLYLWPYIQVIQSRGRNLTERVTRVVKKRNTCRILVRKPEGIRKLWTSRCR
jgi:hypothetical protein